MNTPDRTIKLYNTLSGKKEVFQPITPGHVGMYVCGPTVYSDVHLGNCRTYVSFDVIYRYLMLNGYKVRYVRNITDVGHLTDDGEDRMTDLLPDRGFALAITLGRPGHVRRAPSNGPRTGHGC